MILAEIFEFIIKTIIMAIVFITVIILAIGLSILIGGIAGKSKELKITGIIIMASGIGLMGFALLYLLYHMSPFV